MHRPIAYNLVRSVFSALNRSPRGVDRIDFGYISYLFEHWPKDCFGVLPTPWGMRFYPRDRVLRGRDYLAANWRELAPHGEEPAMKRLEAACALDETAVPSPPSTLRPPNIAGYGRALRLVFGEGIAMGRPVRSLPPGSIYLDIGQYGLTHPTMLRWLDQRPDVAPVFMIHDVIPLQMPHLVANNTVWAQNGAMNVAGRWARAILTPTAAAGESIREELTRRGRPDVPIHPVALPIDDVFHRTRVDEPVLGDRPYFLVCGAIEPRKNHMLLVDVWKRIAAAQGSRTPRLVIAGSPGHRSQRILRDIAAQEGLRGHLVFASGLSTPSLARVMAGARAVLMPSFAEGYGLPPVEAITLGTPAVLSDIAAHREAAGDAGLYAAPDDVPAWTALVEGLTTETPLRAEALSRVARHRPNDWRSYMNHVTEVLAQIE
ncbi:glycosyltransferase, family [Hartmannibacter diazotrophicus]|uniref:Glycosyltransferase, family n=1 Tax=Hartmannibacter diazotrophicus TaxID=1482074 RepID=A0A2C9D3W0_9HYPH|nr:glycosyltransferase family 1 protein [Hartmannibacter diazotrophicus]SON54491.1 glycosyltransferase, family [Hartmannibacter diazotrophicus]